MKKIIIITVMLLCTLGLTYGTAQTAIEEEIEEFEDIEEIGVYSYGQVISISSSKIVISEYDYDAEKNIQSMFTINAETKYENVESYNEIASGDEVEVRYIKDKGQNVAMVIAKEIYESLPEDSEDDLRG